LLIRIIIIAKKKSIERKNGSKMLKSKIERECH